MSQFISYIILCTLGWKMERQAKTLHFTILPSHTVDSARQLVEDLKIACDTVKVRMGQKCYCLFTVQIVCFSHYKLIVHYISILLVKKSGK